MYMLELFTLTRGPCKYLSNRPTQPHVNVLRVCKCIYYMPLMIIPSCKCILISCACIPKLNLFIFAMVHFDWPFSPPNISIFYQYGTMVVLFRAIPKNNLNAHFASPHCWSRTSFMPNIIPQHFDRSFYKSLCTYCDSY